MADQEGSFDPQSGKVILPSRGRNTLTKAILLRIGIALGCIVGVAVSVYVERDGYSDVAPGPFTWLDAFYYSTVTLSTTGYGDIAPVSETARLTNILLVTPLRVVFLVVLIGTAVQALTARTRYEWRVRKWRNTVSKLTVVIGYGVKGRSAVQSLLDSGIPGNQIVVVADDDETIQEAGAQGVYAVVGDARREHVLREAGIERAERVLIATGQDATSVLVTMMVKRLAPANATIVSAARETANAQFLRDSGASGVIVTAEAVGRLLSLSTESRAAGKLMEDLMDSSAGLELLERGITPEELGIGPKDLEERGEIVLAVIRDGVQHRFDQKSIRTFQRDDRIVIIRSSGRGWGDLAPADSLI